MYVCIHTYTHMHVCIYTCIFRWESKKQIYKCVPYILCVYMYTHTHTHIPFSLSEQDSLAKPQGKETVTSVSCCHLGRDGVLKLKQKGKNDDKLSYQN